MAGAALSKDLLLNIGAKDKASNVLDSLGRKADDVFGGKGTGMAALGIGVQAAMVAGAAGVTAMGVAVAESVKVAGNFQQELANVKAVTMASDAEMKKLTDTAKALGSTTAFSASEAAQGMQFLGMAGLSATQIVEAMPAVLDLAAAGTLDLASAADISTNIMSGMALGVSDLNHVMDGLATVASSSNTDVRGVGQAMTFVAGTANAAGLSFDQTAAALGILANAGIQATRGGTSLNAALRSMLNPSKEAQELAEKLGLTFTDNEGRIRPLVDITEDLQDANLTAKQSFVLFGDEGKRAIDALVNQGAPQLRALEQSIEDSENAAKRMAEIKLDTFEGSITELSSAVEGLAITVGTPFLGFLTNSAKLTADVVREVDEFADSIVRVENNLARYNQSGIATEEQQRAIMAGFGQTVTVVEETNTELDALGASAIRFKSGWENNIGRTLDQAQVVIRDNVRPEIALLAQDVQDLPDDIQIDPIDIPLGPKLMGSRAGGTLDEIIGEFEDLPEDVKITPIEIPFDQPEVDQTALAIENTLDSAFSMATGTLIRTGSLKQATTRMFENVLDSAISSVAKDVGSSLSEMFTSAMSGGGGASPMQSLTDPIEGFFSGSGGDGVMGGSSFVGLMSSSALATGMFGAAAVIGTKVVSGLISGIRGSNLTEERVRRAFEDQNFGFNMSTPLSEQLQFFRGDNDIDVDRALGQLGQLEGVRRGVGLSGTNETDFLALMEFLVGSGSDLSGVFGDLNPGRAASLRSFFTTRARDDFANIQPLVDVLGAYNAPVYGGGTTTAQTSTPAPAQDSGSILSRLVETSAIARGRLDSAMSDGLLNLTEPEKENVLRVMNARNDLMTEALGRFGTNTDAAAWFTDRISSEMNIPRFRIGGMKDADGPAYLHAGEGVLSQRGMDNLAMLNNGIMEGFVGGGGNEFHFEIHLHTPDVDSTEQFVENRLGPMIVRYIRESSAFGNEILFSDGVTTPPTV